MSAPATIRQSVDCGFPVARASLPITSNELQPASVYLTALPSA
jgi:hypothetical protein